MLSTGVRVGAAAFAVGIGAWTGSVPAIAVADTTSSAGNTASSSGSSPVRTPGGPRAVSAQNPSAASFFAWPSASTTTTPAATAITAADPVQPGTGADARRGSRVGASASVRSSAPSASAATSSSANGSLSRPTVHAARPVSTVNPDPAASVDPPAAAGAGPAVGGGQSGGVASVVAAVTAPSSANSFGGVVPAASTAVGAPAQKVGAPTLRAVINHFFDTASNWLSRLPASPMKDFVSGALVLVRRWLLPVGQPDYAAILAGSNWDVPLVNQLAYGADAASQFSNPFPLGDQTTWGCQLGSGGCTTTSVTGFTVTSAPGSATTTFVGSATAQFAIGPERTSPSYSSISGTVSPSGAIVMVFTPTDSSGVPTGGSNTLGIGQFENTGGVPEMEMQMITGTSLLVTHWAHMIPYGGPNTAAPAPVADPPTNANPGYSWMVGTDWKIVDPALFGTAAPGSFAVTNYSGGYFYGNGVGPASNPISFTELGSITPQGKVLFNTLATDSATLISSYGQLTGSNGRAVIAMPNYSNDTGAPTGSSTTLILSSPQDPCGRRH